MPDLVRLEATCLALVREAGDVALAHFQAGGQTSARISWKDGGSPVTAADHAVDAFLCERLGAILPAALWYSEEQPASWINPHRKLAFVIDPIDGTRQFMDGSPGWCISLALVADGVPVLGIVHSPVLDETLHGSAGAGAYRNGKRLGQLLSPEAPLRFAGPKYAGDFLRARIQTPIAQMPHVSALARRVACTATGAHDLALARPGAHDWDIAAADCLLREVGGGLLGINGEAIQYALDGSELPAFLAGERQIIRKIAYCP